MYENTISPTVSLYRANKAAADEFYAAVNVEWFFNRPLIQEKLERMASTYIATGEDNSAKLGELRRLKIWTSEATSVADQQQYLSEVRSNGRVVMQESLYSESETGLVMSFLLWVLSVFGIEILSFIFSEKPTRSFY